MMASERTGQAVGTGCVHNTERGEKWPQLPPFQDSRKGSIWQERESIPTKANNVVQQRRGVVNR